MCTPRQFFLLLMSLFGPTATVAFLPSLYQPPSSFLSIDQRYQQCTTSCAPRNKSWQDKRNSPSNSNIILLPSSSSRWSFPLFMMARYGPQDTSNNNNIEDGPSSTISYKAQLKAEFTTLLHKILNDTTPEEDYPSLMAQNIEMILDVIGYDRQNEDVDSGGDILGGSMLEEIIQEQVQSGNGYQLDQISDAVNMILSFVETFVEQTKSMDDIYKKLLGKIFQSIAPGGSPPEISDTDRTPATTVSASSASALENQLDQLLSSNKEAFTPGFLRHVEGECERISSLKTISPESARMLQILRVIQARVLEELGKGIGEGAVVLGQLLGYENEAERLAVLDAGLAVRGIDFAKELAALTEEALEGFERTKEAAAMAGGGGVDPELVMSVESMDGRIRQFIEREGGAGDFQ